MFQKYPDIILEHAAHKDHFSRGSNGQVGLNSEVTSMGRTETPPVNQLGWNIICQPAPLITG